MRGQKINTFSNEFKGKRHFDQVKQRKNELVEQYMKSVSPQLPVTRVIKRKKTADAIFEYLEKADPGKSFEGRGGRIKHFSARPTRLIFRSTNDKETVCDYIAVEYYRPYLVKPDHSGIERFTYFEVYYGNHILFCLMDMKSFQTANSFLPLDMEQGEWARLKQNMLLWNHAIYPNLKEIEAEDVLPEPIAKRYRFYKEFYKSQELKQLLKQRPEYPKETANLIWPLAAYVFLMLHLPALPWKWTPRLLINFSCEQGGLIQDLATWLQAYLSDCVREIPGCTDEIQIAKSWLNSRYSAGTAQPYVRLLSRPQEADKVLRELHEVSTNGNSRWNMHPFAAMVPICVSGDSILDSAVLNLPVSAKDFEDLKQSKQVDPRRFLIFLSSLADDTEEGEWLDMDELRKQFKRAGEKLLEAAGRKSFPAHTHASAMLATAFLTMYGRETAKFKVSDERKRWFEAQLKLWDEQTDSFHKMIHGIMRMAAEDAAKTQEGIPGNKEELEAVYRGRFIKDGLLCYTLSRFADRVRKAYPQADVLEVREQLKSDGVLKSNGSRTDYNVSVGGKSQEVIAFYLDKLHE